MGMVCCYSRSKKFHFPHPFVDLVPAVKKVDSTTHGINLLPVDRAIIGVPNTGADPGFFLGGGALVSCCTSTPINHIVFFF